MVYSNLIILAVYQNLIGVFRQEGATVTSRKRDENLDQGVIDSFGHEWATFDYGETETTEALNAQFKAYCAPIDLNQFNPKVSVAADFGG